MPLYNLDVNDGLITAIHDIRPNGGHKIEQIADLKETLSNKAGAQDMTTKLAAKQDKASAVTWLSDVNGVRAVIGKFAGTGKPIVVYFTTGQPSASSAEHRVWIQIDNFKEV